MGRPAFIAFRSVLVSVRSDICFLSSMDKKNKTKIMQDTTLEILPYKVNGINHRRLIVKPISKPQSEKDGLIIPTDVGKLCELGEVVSADRGSFIKEGDIIQYNVNRESVAFPTTINYEGNTYDIVYEHFVMSYNNKPLNKVFVKPLRESAVCESGLILPATAEDITEKGIVFNSPAEYLIKKGDIVEFRKNLDGIYTTINIDNEDYLVLFEQDIFIVNGKVAPYRIIVKIDKEAQEKKRTKTDGGLLLSPKFIAMKRNLQYGEVSEIGPEAQKHYPGLNVGDIAILHHGIEEDPIRVIRKERGKNLRLNYEYRIIDCWEEGSRQIFGVVKRHSKIKDDFRITPFGDHVFLSDKFEVFAKKPEGSQSSIFTSLNVDISHVTDLNEMENLIDRKRKDFMQKYNMEMGRIQSALKSVNLRADKDKYDTLETQLKSTQIEATRLGSFSRENHMVVCDVLFPKEYCNPGDKIVATYKELYPYDIFEHKFIIAYTKFIIAKLKKDNMNENDFLLEPMADCVLVKLLPEPEKKQVLIGVTSGNDGTHRAEVVALGPGTSFMTSIGDIVLIRQKSGIPVLWRGGKHLIVKEGQELLARISPNR